MGRQRNLHSLKEEEFAQFVAHCRWWKDRLGLSNYTMEAEYKDDIDGGECEFNHESLLITVRMGETDDFWTPPVVARHEMLEVLMEPMYNITKDNVAFKITYRAAHEIIHRLEDILPLPTDKEVGFVGCGGKKKKPKGK